MARGRLGWLRLQAAAVVATAAHHLHLPPPPPGLLLSPAPARPHLTSRKRPRPPHPPARRAVPTGNDLGAMVGRVQAFFLVGQLSIPSLPLNYRVSSSQLGFIQMDYAIPSTTSKESSVQKKAQADKDGTTALEALVQGAPPPPPRAAPPRAAPRARG